MEKYYIGIDNGGTFIKASLFDVNGRQIWHEKVKNDISVCRNGCVELDPDYLWQMNCDCVSRLMKNSKVPAQAVENISIAGQGKGLYVVDSEGNAIRNAITSADSRSFEIVEEWHKKGIAEEIYQYTYQGLFSSHPVSILRWLKENEPENYRKIKWIFSMKDFLVYRMTGTAIADFSNQSGNSYMNLNTGEYEYKIFQMLGIEEAYDKLPPLYHAADICGKITEEAAQKMGCLPGTKVTAGMFDVNASAVGMGIVSEDRIGVIAGTCGVNAYISKEPVKNHGVLMNSYYCIPEYYYIEEGSNTSTGMIEWVIDTLYPEEKKERGKDIYKYLDEIIQGKEINEGGACFLPFLYGSALNSRSRGTWTGLTPVDDKNDMLQACYEGIIFTHRWHIDRLLKNRKKPDAIRLAGGIIRSKVWVKLFADILQFPIEVVEGEDIGGHGLAIVSGIASGEYSTYENAVENCVHIKETVYPDIACKDIYNKKYAYYLSVAKKLGCI